MKRAVKIIGAGFSGLTAAYYLIRAGHPVEILEQSTELGGLIHTSKLPYGLSESAANAFLNSLSLEEMAKEIGIELVPCLPTSRHRFLFRNGLPKRWPLSLSESLPLVKCAFGFLTNKSKLAPQAGESVTEWGNRNVGEAASHYLLSTALQGIYAGDPNQMSASLLLGHLFKKSKPQKPSIRGSVSPKEGMSSFLQALEKYLLNRGVKIRYGVHYEYKAEPEAEILVCTGAKAAASLFSSSAPEISSVLNEIDILPLLSVTIFYRSEMRSIPGFGCLIPRGEGFRAIGILANHNIFPNRNKNSISETWIFGGALDREILTLSDAEILNLLQKERSKIYPENPSPLELKIHRWPQAIPHYTVKLEKQLPQLPKIEGVHLHGNYLGQIGLTKILEESKKLPEKINA